SRHFLAPGLTANHLLEVSTHTAKSPRQGRVAACPKSRLNRVGSRHQQPSCRQGSTSTGSYRSLTAPLLRIPSMTTARNKLAVRWRRRVEDMRGASQLASQRLPEELLCEPTNGSPEFHA